MEINIYNGATTSHTEVADKYCRLATDYRTVNCKVPVSSYVKQLRLQIYSYSYPSNKYSIRASLIDPYTLPLVTPKDVGDLIARDLDIPVFGGALGHIGMWDGTKVLHVAPGPKVVHKSTFRAFQAPGRKYWCARYGKGSRIQRLKAIAAGWEQRKYKPEYVVSGYFREGKYVTKWSIKSIKWRRSGFLRWPVIEWKKSTKLQTARFRCDTFVDYSFRKAGIRLTSGISTPKIVFNSMPLKRKHKN